MAFTNNYVLGRGKVYFNRFAAGTTTPIDGERYIGNTPEFNTTSAEDTLEHYSSDGGLKVKDKSVTLQINRTGSFTTDNIDQDNLALLFSGTAATVTQAAATAQTQRVVGQKGRYYQLGVSASNPAGVRNVTNVVVKDTATTPATIAATNYTVDLVLGRVYFKDDATGITNGTNYDITYDVTASTFEQVISKNDTVYGSIRFIADNAVGQNRDFYLPYVKLAPNGDYALKGDEWQQISFNMEILKLNDTVEAMYVNGRPTTP